MGNKPLITESKLSWIRDTSVETPAAPKEPVSPPEPKAGRPAREHSEKPAAEPPRQAPQKRASYETQGRSEPSSAPRRAPEYSARIEAPRVARYTFDQDPIPEQPYRPDPRYVEQQAVRQDAYYGAQRPPQGGMEPVARPKVRKPGIIHYALALVALICVAIAPIPERISNLIFLGFIFIILLEISYRIGQHYHQDRLNSEYLQRILFHLRQDERSDRQGPR